MLQLRNRPRDARFASFGLGLCVFALIPNEIGYQDIASLLARQPGVAERWQKRVFSAASTIQVATYAFGRPIGTSIPQTATYRLVVVPLQPAAPANTAPSNEDPSTSNASVAGAKTAAAPTTERAPLDPEL